MIINANTLKDLQSKLTTFQSEHNKIDEKIKQTPRTNKGALSFGYFQLNRQKQTLQSKILKINSILNPDIIA